MEKDNGWDPQANIPGQVNWTAHGRALNRHEPQKVTLVKYLHNILPVGKVVHSYDPKYKDECPTCNQPQEDQHHLCRCPDPSRELWRVQTMRAIRKKMSNLNTNPALMEIVIDGISAYLKDEPQIDDTNYNGIYCLLIASQNNIGRDNFLKGMLSIHFATHQDTYTPTEEQSNKKKGTTWTTTMAAFVLGQWLKLWKQQNEDHHGKDKAAQTKARMEQLHREVELLYEKADEAPPEALEDIFKCDLETQLLKSYAELVAWLANWIPVVDAKLRKQRNQPITTTQHTSPTTRAG
jgi:hypothetical protein